MADSAGRFEGEKGLQDMVRSDARFHLLGAFPVSGNEPEWKIHNLYLYENTQWVPPTSPTVHIRVLTSHFDVDVPWNQVISASAAKAAVQCRGSIDDAIAPCRPA